MFLHSKARRSQSRLSGNAATCVHSSHLPQWDLNSQVPVDGHSQQAENGALGQHQHEAGEEEAAVKIHLESDADGDGKRDG